MSSKHRLFKSEEKQSRSDVSAFLHELADKIGEGQVVLRQGDSEVVLEIPENLVLEIKADQKDKKGRGPRHSLEIEIQWYDDDQEAPLELA